MENASQHRALSEFIHSNRVSLWGAVYWTEAASDEDCFLGLCLSLSYVLSIVNTRRARCSVGLGEDPGEDPGTQIHGFQITKSNCFVSVLLQ